MSFLQSLEPLHLHLEQVATPAGRRAVTLVVLLLVLAAGLQEGALAVILVVLLVVLQAARQVVLPVRVILKASE